MSITGPENGETTTDDDPRCGSRLLERGSQLGELNRLLAGCRAGSGHVALVCGEPGAGKTALVTAFTRPHRNTLRLLTGRCEPSPRKRPLGPLRDMARRAGSTFAAILNGSASHTTACEALLDEVARQPAPTVILIEDVQWSDQATLEALAFLAQRLDDCPALVLLTCREEQTPPEHPLHAVLAGVPAGRLSRIPVPPLSPEAVATLARHAGFDEPGLHRRTGGNAMLVTEILAVGTPGVVPPRIAATVRAGLAALCPEARDVVLLTTLCPNGAEAGLLEHAAAGECALVAQGVAAGLLAWDGTGRIGPRTEVIREALLETLPPLRRRDLHRQILDSLQRPGAEADPARLVHHAEACGESEVVLTQARAAARLAAGAGDHRGAIAFYDRALSHAGPLGFADRAALWEALGEQAALAGDSERARAALQAALSFWQEAGRPDRIGRGWRRLADLSWADGFPAAADAAVAKAVAVLEPYGPSRQLALAYADRCRLNTLRGRLVTARVWGERAVLAAESAGDPQTLATCLVDLGTARLAGSPAGGLADLHRAATEALAHDLTETAGRALTAVVQQHTSHRQHPEALAGLDRALDPAVSGGSAGQSRALLSVRSWLHLNSGEWERARQDAESALAATGGGRGVAALARTTLIRLQIRGGQWPREEELSLADCESRAGGDLYAQAQSAIARAELVWLRDVRYRPPEDLATVLARARGARHPWLAGELAWWLHRAGGGPEPSGWYAEPYRLLMSGHWRAAADAWRALDCPYDRAEALACGDDPAALLLALDLFGALGAEGAARQVRFRLRRLDRTLRVPRGPRPATAANPAGLTPRQLEVLALLADGKSNADIAASLSLSVRTAEHHVAAILTKLSVDSRSRVPGAARRLGIAVPSRA